MMTFIIFIAPKAQTRPKFSRYSGAYEDPKMRAWRKQVTDYIKAEYDGRYFDGAVRVEVTFYMPAPKAMSKRPTPKARAQTWERYNRYIAEQIPHDKKLDIDNLIKSLFDSITKSEMVWTDDGLVCDVHAKKYYSPNPRMEITIEEIE